jgi:hypothetical protein
VLNALEFAHQRQIVYRDVKPSNILLDRQDNAFLGDFGIVLAVNEKRLTQAGTVMGTAHYMSPEQITQPANVDRRADIYSFGCVLFEMLTGHPPFDIPSGRGDTDFAVKMAQVNTPAPSPRRWKPAIPPALEAVLMRCLAKDPRQRFQTCGELREALIRALAPKPPAPAKPNAALWVVGSVVLFVLLTIGVAAGVLFWPRDPEIQLFRASSVSINSGESVTLSWAVKNAKQVEISGLGTQSASGMTTLKPEHTITYTLTAKNGSRSMQRDVLILVEPPPRVPLVIQRFEATPDRIKAGAETVISWSVTGAETVKLGKVDVAFSGTAPLRLERTATYELWARASDGTTRSAKLTIEVIQDPPPAPKAPEIITFKTMQTVITAGEKVELVWSVRGATKIMIGKVTVAAEGREFVKLDTDSTFTMVAEGPGGSTTRKIAVTVLPARRTPAPASARIVSFTATPLVIYAGTTVQLRYNVTGATRIQINPEVGNLTSSGGTVSVFPARTTTYRLIAFDASGAAVSAETTVLVLTRP